MASKGMQDVTGVSQTTADGRSQESRSLRRAVGVWGSYALLDRAEVIARRYTTNLTKRILKARMAGLAIVSEAEERPIDMILIANSPTHMRRGMQQLDPAVEYVLKNAPCEVLVLSQGQRTAISRRTGEMEESSMVIG